MTHKHKFLLKSFKEGRYTCSTKGKIYSANTGKNMSLFKDKRGYLRVSLNVEKKVFNYPAHRVVYFFFDRNGDHRKCINHKNGNKSDNRVSNLELVTHSENTRHGIETGLIFNPPETARSAKLNWKSVRKIRAMRGVPLRVVAEKFGVSVSTISEVQNNRIWKEI